MSQIGLILQARMGSTRLPGKVLMPIAGRPLLDHIFQRLLTMVSDATLVVATSDLPKDDAIADHCESRAVACCRGDEEDVLARYYHCARIHGFEQIVRLTGDNPFVDAAELDRLIDFHVREGNDYSQSFDHLPVGVGAEIFTFEALCQSFEEGKEPHHREHVDEYMLEHPEKFKSGVLQVIDEKSHPDIRLTVDTPADYALACRLAAHAGGSGLRTEEAIELCSQSA